jgi:ABC-2 type transport system permease protein
MLNLSRSSMFLSEGLGGIVYFLSGVIFPLSILPVWLQVVGAGLPTTYWLEGMRRAILNQRYPGPLEGMSEADLLLWLLGSTAGLVVASQVFYRWSVRRAWRNGKIEEATGQ